MSRPPQLENGYTRIANEILEAIARHSFTSREYKILIILLRKTYGYGKKKDRISCSQFARLTGIARHHCNEILTALHSKNVVTKSVPSTGNSVVVTWGLQKDYSKWVVFPLQGTVPKIAKGVPSTGNKGVPSTGTHKRKKEIYKRKGNDDMATKLDKIFSGTEHLEEQMKISQKEQNYNRVPTKDPGFNPNTNAPVKVENEKAKYISHSELYDDGVQFDSMTEFLEWKKISQEDYQNLPQIDKTHLWEEYLARS